jgi:subtilisin-like proprotein convertase family protein
MNKSFLTFICLLSIVQLTAQSFVSTPNQILSEGNLTYFTQSISGLPTNQNYYFGLYEIDINLLHPITGDVYLRLQAPDGTSVDLSNYYGTGANFNHAKFRYIASQSITTANSPFSDVYMPVNKLSDFQNGSDPNGTWTLTYYDVNTNNKMGTLLSWQLTFKILPKKLAADSMVTNLPIINFVMPSSIPSSPKLSGSIQLFGLATNAVINAPTNIYNVGAEIQGFTSSGGSKPNYEFEIRNASGAGLNVPLFGMPAESDWVLKSGYTDDYMMKDPLTFEFSRRMGYYAPRTKHIELFINGEYQGLYVLMEKVKKGINRVDISKIKTSDTLGANLTGGYIFEINPNNTQPDWYSNYLGYNGSNQTNSYEFKVVYPKRDSLKSQQRNYLHSYVDSFENAMAGANFQDTLNGWRKYVNEKSFMDFLIVSEYSINYDTYGRSMYFSKDKSTKGNKINVGPPWDSDRGYYAPNLAYGWVHITTHGGWTFPFWWVKARQDTLFEKRLACRFKTARKYILTDTAINNYINSLDILLVNAIEREKVLWNKYFDNSVNLKNTLIARLNWMDTNLQTVSFPPVPVVANNIYTGNVVNINIGNNYFYNFRPGPDTSYFVPSIAGNYTAVIANEYGCESQRKFTVKQSVPLSVSSIELGATYKNNETNLQWTYFNNNENNKYEIEHSINGLDFMQIGILQSSNEYCNFLHKTAVLKNYYRIKLLKNNNTIYSNTIMVSNKPSISKFTYPNPAKDILYIQNINADKISIYNIEGRLLMAQSFKTFEIDISMLPKGVYFLELLVGDQKMREQFIKE